MKQWKQRTMQELSTKQTTYKCKNYPLNFLQLNKTIQEHKPHLLNKDIGPIRMLRVHARTNDENLKGFMLHFPELKYLLSCQVRMPPNKDKSSGVLLQPRIRSQKAYTPTEMKFQRLYSQLKGKWFSRGCMPQTS